MCINCIEKATHLSGFYNCVNFDLHIVSKAIKEFYMIMLVLYQLQFGKIENC